MGFSVGSMGLVAFSFSRMLAGVAGVEKFSSVSHAQVGSGAERWKGGAFWAPIGLVEPFHLCEQVRKGLERWLEISPSPPHAQAGPGAERWKGGAF